MVLEPALLPELCVAHVDTQADSLARNQAPEVGVANIGTVGPVKLQKVAVRSQDFAGR